MYLGIFVSVDVFGYFLVFFGVFWGSFVCFCVFLGIFDFVDVFGSFRVFLGLFWGSFGCLLVSNHAIE